jgi:hypothetical protein
MINKSNRKLKMNHPTPRTRTVNTFKTLKTSIKKWPKRAKKNRMSKFLEARKIKIKTKNKPKKKHQPLSKTVNPRKMPRMMPKKKAKRKLMKLE